ncbi:beta-ketoacyl synthase N-terminal-like domain-containing protein [Dickeya dadantii subsp. dieffenbachiae]|uniref:beta-ketoacyl synthase N-terminal-like domain-containing protein n=1 Tax=Dickeya dadantii TaxID=204038 RepID=UPI0003A66723|nr:beta-ketoacyl synthase N-terminal-like domain-containing protein [Dickeya dadantii]
MSTGNAVRIVVTGTGLVGPLGCGSETVWSRLLAGQSGIRTLPAEFTEGTGTLIGGQVPDRNDDPLAGYDAGDVIAPKERKKIDRFIELALMAAKEALTQAGWNPGEEAQRQRTATIITSGVGGFGAIADAVRTTDERGPRRLSPFTAPSFLANMAAGHVSIAHGFKGPLGAPVTACAAGVQAIGDAARLIRSGEADIALCGGTEAALHRVALGCFAAARALSTAFNHRPQEASRPFDRDRDGFVMAEGAGLLVIESLNHALGAAGGIEAIVTILALRDQMVPPTLNLTHPDELASGLNLVATSARAMPMQYALSNGFGFGGVNASVLFRRWEAD